AGHGPARGARSTRPTGAPAGRPPRDAGPGYDAGDRPGGRHRSGELPRAGHAGTEPVPGEPCNTPLTGIDCAWLPLYNGSKLNTMNDSTALVTGANKGIGREIARQLAAAGLTVWLGSRDASRGQRAVDEIGGGRRLLLLGRPDPRG